MYIEENQKVYKVEHKEIEFYPMIEAQVNTPFYESFLDDKQELKKYYDDYLSRKREDSIFVEKHKQLADYLTNYFDTKDKALLDKANELSNNLQLQITIPDKNPKYRGRAFPPDKELYIKKGNKYAPNKTLKEFLFVINKRIENHRTVGIDNQSSRYLKHLEREKTLKDSEKTKLGWVKTDTPSKRPAYMATNQLAEGNELVGSFIEISSSVYVVDYDYEDKFVKGEISEEVFKKVGYDPFDKKLTLIQNTDSGLFYVMPYSEFSSLSFYNTKEKWKSKLENMGYKPYHEYSQLIINTKYYKIEVGNYLFEILEENPQYIKNLDTHYEKILGLRTQANSFVPKLEKYFRIYQIQRNKMSTSDVNAWTKIAKEAQVIYLQLHKLEFETLEITPTPLDEKYYSKMEDFTDYMIASKNVLGL